MFIQIQFIVSTKLFFRITGYQSNHLLLLEQKLNLKRKALLRLQIKYYL